MRLLDARSWGGSGSCRSRRGRGLCLLGKVLGTYDAEEIAATCDSLVDSGEGSIISLSVAQSKSGVVVFVD